MPVCRRPPGRETAEAEDSREADGRQPGPGGAPALEFEFGAGGGGAAEKARGQRRALPLCVGRPERRRQGGGGAATGRPGWNPRSTQPPTAPWPPLLRALPRAALSPRPSSTSRPYPSRAAATSNDNAGVCEDRRRCPRTRRILIFCSFFLLLFRFLNGFSRSLVWCTIAARGY